MVSFNSISPCNSAMILLEFSRFYILDSTFFWEDQIWLQLEDISFPFFFSIKYLLSFPNASQIQLPLLRLMIIM